MSFSTKGWRITLSLWRGPGSSAGNDSTSAAFNAFVGSARSFGQECSTMDGGGEYFGASAHARWGQRESCDPADRSRPPVNRSIWGSSICQCRTRMCGPPNSEDHKITSNWRMSCQVKLLICSATSGCRLWITCPGNHRSTRRPTPSKQPFRRRDCSRCGRFSFSLG